MKTIKEVKYEEKIKKLQDKIMILKEIVSNYEIDLNKKEYEFINDLKRILWDKENE